MAIWSFSLEIYFKIILEHERTIDMLAPFSVGDMGYITSDKNAVKAILNTALEYTGRIYLPSTSQSVRIITPIPLYSTSALY